MLSDISLRCYAEGNSEGWEAACIDLDISVQGNTYEDVYVSLDTSIQLYFKTLSDLPEADQIRLLNRKAPLFVRLSLIAKILKIQLSNHAPKIERHDFVRSSLCLS